MPNKLEIMYSDCKKEKKVNHHKKVSPIRLEIMYYHVCKKEKKVNPHNKVSPIRIERM